MIGKISPEELENYVFHRLGAVDEDVLVGPGYGEDTAAVDLGERTLVINSDPIIYAADRVGTLGVNIAGNDLAASGAEPKWLTVTYLLPDGRGEALDKITRQVDRAASDLGISVVGGHSEYVPQMERPFLALTCFGITERYVPTSGGKAGDKLLLTKGAGIEGTGIIATDFQEELEGKVPPEVIRKGAKRMEELSVLPEGLLLRDYAHALHDPTEGGVVDGLFELAVASGLALEVNREDVVVNPDTEQLCNAMGVDPLKIFGSGALVASLPDEKASEALQLLRNRGIKAAVIGETCRADQPWLKVDDKVYREPVRDQLYELWD